MSSNPSFSMAARNLLSRRDFLGGAATGLSSVALVDLLSQEGLLAADRPTIDPAKPHAPRQPHFPARAKRVLVIFCAGACSQLETWDYKPELTSRVLLRLVMLELNLCWITFRDTQYLAPKLGIYVTAMPHDDLVAEVDETPQKRIINATRK